jgi:hypothetical protein
MDSRISTPHLAASPHDDGELSVRINAEFGEMPGLRLTLPQAARLFNVERTQCERVLGALVKRGALASDGRAFVRLHPSRSMGTR